MYPSTTASVYDAADPTTRSRRCDLGSWGQLTAVHGKCLLELMLRVQGIYEELFCVTPLQAGVLCYVREHSGVGLVVVAAAFRVELLTLVDVVQHLVRKGWIAKRRAIEDRRAVSLKLSRKGKILTRKIASLILRVENMLNQQERAALCMSHAMISSVP